MNLDPQGTTPIFSADRNLDKLISKIYLHQGRTDENGGHHDWLNRMGWGFGRYHYHHGLSAHLHPNMVCPYGELKASIINPYTNKKIYLGSPCYYDGKPYFSLNLVSKALTARDSMGVELTPENTGGIFSVCSAGDSSIIKLGEEFTFSYPKLLLSIRDNTLFETDGGKLSLLCHKEKADLDDIPCYAYISLETVRNYMLKEGYFTDFSDNDSGVWLFEVRKPSIQITMPVDGDSFITGDEIAVNANIKNVAQARLIVGEHMMGYTNGFEEFRTNLEKQNAVTFSKFKLGKEQIGSLPISIKAHTGGTAVQADIDANLFLDALRIQVERPEKIEKLDSVGLNMIANMERNISTIKYDKTSGKIVSIPTIFPDVGYGHDVSENPMNPIPDFLSAMESLELLKKDIVDFDFEKPIVTDINAYFTQNQFNALVSLKYNIGNLGVIIGLLEYLEKASYEREEMKNLILSYYESKIIENPSKEQYRDGWYSRTEKFLDVFFDGNYGKMPIDAINGIVIN